MALNNFELECSICNEVLADPRALPCGHSFCGPPRVCLEALRYSTGGLKCAICREEYPNLNALNLNPLYGIRDLFPATSRHKTNLPYLPCDVHAMQECTFWCNTCSCMICNQCFEVEHDSHLVKKLKSYLIEKIESKTGKCLQDAIASFKESITEIVNEKKKLMEKYSSYVKSIEGDIRQMNEENELLAEFGQLSRSDDPNRVERETALLSKISHFRVGVLHPCEYSFYHDARNQDTLQTRCYPKSILSDSSSNQLLTKFSPRDKIDAKFEKCNKIENLFTGEPLLLLVAFRLLDRKPLKLGSSVKFDSWPLQFWFTAQFSKTSGSGGSRLHILAHCRLLSEENSNHSNIEWFDGSFSYTFCLRNLFDYKKDIVKSGVWDSPVMTQPLCWYPLTSENLADPRNGWIVKHKDLNEYVEISLMLKSVPKLGILKNFKEAVRATNQT